MEGLALISRHGTTSSLIFSKVKILIAGSVLICLFIALLIGPVNICCSKERFDFDRITENKPH
jgi:hypothetical protein